MTKVLLSNKYTYIIGLLLAVIVACSIALYVKQTDSPLQISGELEVKYTTIDQLKNASDLIVEVKAADVGSLKYEGLAFSLVNAEVKKVYKGDVGKNVNILETGGTVEGQEYVFEDSPVFKKNESAIVFLRKYIGPVTENAYVVTGAIQGKFKMDGDKLKAPKHAEGELAGK